MMNWRTRSETVRINNYLMVKSNTGFTRQKIFSGRMGRERETRGYNQEQNNCFKSSIHFIIHVRWVPLSPRHGASSSCGWKGRPPALDVSCEYIE
jgi:hypothetical protein